MDNSKIQAAFNTKHRTKYKQKREKQQRKLKWRATRTSPKKKKQKKNQRVWTHVLANGKQFSVPVLFFLESLVLYVSAMILLYWITLVRLLFSMYFHLLSKLFSSEICFLPWHSDTNAINFYLLVYLLILY
jgi:Flp pilus assembly protein TadB